MDCYTQRKCYVDRGNYVTNDVRTIGDFTVDGAYHELDLSDVVPKGAKAVEVRVKARATAVAKVVKLRPHGATSLLHTCIISSQVENVFINSNVVIGVDKDAKVDILIDTEYNAVGLIVRGWWF